MDVDGVPQTKAKAARRKVFEVNTKKATAAKDLEKYLNPANQFEEMTSPRARRGGVSVYRYFFYKPDPVNGPPKGFFETIVQSISSVVAPAPSSQGNNVAANVPDSNVDEILHKMRDVGVDSQNEFDRLAEMLESKANISGGAQKKKSLKRQTKSQRKRQRKRQTKHYRNDHGRTHKK